MNKPSRHLHSCASPSPVESRPLPVINLELTLLTTAFLRATESWKAGRQFKPQTDWAPTLWYLTGCATGKARLAVVVGISQSPQNGWETWFSCTWGDNIAKLEAPCNKLKALKINAAVKAAKKEVEAAEEAVAKTSKDSKYLLYRLGMVGYTKERLACACSEYHHCCCASTATALSQCPDLG